MKQTGVIRKIDELGRIVLPKEIRRNLGIRDGESLEIFVDEKGVYLQKYSKIFDMKNLGKQIVQNVVDLMHLDMLLLDRDKIIASSIERVYGLKIPLIIDQYMTERESYESKFLETLFNDELSGYFLMKPIIVSADCLGMAIFYKESSFDEWERNFLDFVVQLFVQKIDVE